MITAHCGGRTDGLFLSADVNWNITVPDLADENVGRGLRRLRMSAYAAALISVASLCCNLK
jgi:hypothetical protein